jgi:protease-4
MSTARQFGRIGITVVVGLVLAGVGYALFVVLPGGSLARLLGVVLAVAGGVAGLRAGRSLADSVLATYDVAEVAVDGPITRDGGTPGPVGLSGVAADDVVEQIERADADDAAEALVVKLNTPGGAVVPSEDIRVAAAEFDGPTVAYAEDLAASGGYWIASGTDWIHAREGTIVGSIGVRGSQLGRTELAEKAGLDYRRFVAGDYKDARSPWREMRDDEVEYVQGLLEESYDQFVDTVTAGRDLGEEFVRDTEARVYTGRTAAENGLVDVVGPRDEMEADLAAELGVDEVEIREFEPEEALTDRLSMGARSVAYAFGAGVARGVLGDDDRPPVELR